MTRGLYPPDTLSKDDIYTLQQLRKDLWYNAFIGGGESRRGWRLERRCCGISGFERNPTTESTTPPRNVVGSNIIIIIITHTRTHTTHSFP